MRKILFLLACVSMVSACEKHDPILPGDRTAIFTSWQPTMLNTDVPNVPDVLPDTPQTDCPYTQDSNNIIRDESRKIFSGFSTPNSVQSTQKPVCSGNFIYAGMTTGELVKINVRTRAIAWIADIYSPSNMTGGSSVVDITAPIILADKYVYVGGLGDAFCKINANTGVAVWCDKIGVSVPFIVTDDTSFVVGTDNYLYAVRNSDGAIYWRTSVKKQSAPTYENKIIKVGKNKIDAQTGKKIK